MFSHVVLGADDVGAAKRFYDAVLGALGIPQGAIDDRGRLFYRHSGGVLGITRPLNGDPACGANGGTVGFAANSTDEVHAWHEAGLAHGGTAVEDPPGPREMNGRTLYLAYLRDPSGNKICALHRVARG